MKKTMKQYEVRYRAKYGLSVGRVHVYSLLVVAETAREACAKVKKMCAEELGMNVFDLSAKVVQ